MSLPPSLPIPNHKIDAFTAPRGLKFCTELILWPSRSPTIPGSHPSTQGWSSTNLRMVTNQFKDGHPKKEVYYRHGIWRLLTELTPGDNCHGWSHTIPRGVTHQPEDGHSPNQRWSPTWRKCTTDMKFGTYTLLTKLTHVDNCHEWSPTILRMVVRAG